MKLQGARHAIGRYLGSGGDGAARVPFNLAAPVGRERAYVEEALSSNALTGDGKFTRMCEDWIQRALGARRALVTPSCTAALELAALMLDLAPGDEVIMPSFTYVSTANAFVLRGAVPVFVDVHPDTLTIDENQVAAAVTARTKAIIPVHYAGWPCAMEAVSAIAEPKGIAVVEDAAQAVLATRRGRALGSIGRFGCISFHGTKNVGCGHGGALLINRDEDCARAEIIRDRGTDRRRFLEGDVQKYSWVDVGSSYFLSEICSAYLMAQLEQVRAVTAKRVAICATYERCFAPLRAAGRVAYPERDTADGGNGHIFYLLTRSADERIRLLAHLTAAGIEATFHYTPLHDSPAGRRFGRAVGDLAVTMDASQRILRLPVFPAMERRQVEHVIAAVEVFFAR